MSQTSIAASAPDATDASSKPNQISSRLEKIAPFADLSKGALEALCKTAVERQYDAGQTVYSIGQFDGGDVIIVADGRMQVSITAPATQSITIEEFSPNEIFGLEFAISAWDPSTFEQMAVVAPEPLSVILLEAEALRDIAAQKPSLMRNLALYFANGLCRLRLAIAAPETAPEQRVYAALLKFVTRDDMNGLWRVPRMPRHRELAELANVEETEAASAVATLIQDGVAERDYPGLIINDMTRLDKLAN
ncbi:MAG: cyclic nucleotide-binding domain-containing protein [Pseudomonadota bacterium]